MEGANTTINLDKNQKKKKVNLNPSLWFLVKMWCSCNIFLMVCNRVLSRLYFCAYFYNQMLGNKYHVNKWKNVWSDYPFASSVKTSISFYSNRNDKNLQLPFRVIQPVFCPYCQAGKVAYLLLENGIGRFRLYCETNNRCNNAMQ